jgi:hypothetical protein
MKVSHIHNLHLLCDILEWRIRYGKGMIQYIGITLFLFSYRESSGKNLDLLQESSCSQSQSKYRILRDCLGLPQSLLVNVGTAS